MDGNFLIIPSPTFMHFRCGLNESGQSPPLALLDFFTETHLRGCCSRSAFGTQSSEDSCPTW